MFAVKACFPRHNYLWTTWASYFVLHFTISCHQWQADCL